MTRLILGTLTMIDAALIAVFITDIYKEVTK